MKLEIALPVAELKAALPGFSKIIGKRTTLPILGGIRISFDDHEEQVILEATNLEEIVQLRLNRETNGMTGAVVLPFDAFAKIVKGCSGKESICVITEGEKTVLRYPLGNGMVDQPVEALDLAEWPVTPVIDTKPMALKEEFKGTLQEALACASTDPGRYVLNGACLDVSYPTGHYVVGASGHQLYAANTFQFDLKTSVLVPSKRFLGWDRFLQDGPWHLRVKKIKDEESWLRLDSDHWSYLVRQIEGVFPNWKQAVPTPNDKWTTLEFDEKAVETLRGAIPMLPGRTEPNEPIELEIRENRLIVKGRHKGEPCSELPVEGVRITGPALEFSMHRQFLLNALRFGFRHLQVQDPVSAMVFTLCGKTMVVMPLRGEAAQKYLADHPPEKPTGAAAAPSPAEPPTTTTEPERKEMETMTVPPRGNLTGQPKTETTAIEDVLTQIEKVREDLRQVFNDLNETERLLKKVAKDQKVSEKEMAKARNALRSLQSVEI